MLILIIDIPSLICYFYKMRKQWVFMRDMTDEEYKALDERLTKTVPTLGPNGMGFFSQKGFQVVGLDESTAKILNAKAIASRRTPSEIIASMLRSELTVAHIH